MQCHRQLGAPGGATMARRVALGSLLLFRAAAGVALAGGSAAAAEVNGAVRARRFLEAQPSAPIGNASNASAGVGPSPNSYSLPAGIAYATRPAMWPPAAAVGVRTSGELDANWAATEATSAMARAATAKSLEATANAALVASTQEVTLSLEARKAVATARRIDTESRLAEASDRRVKQIAVAMQQVAKSAAERAIQDVVQNTVARLNSQARDEVELMRSTERMRAENAAMAAQVAAVPYRAAKLRSGQAMVSYLVQARELSVAAVQLQKKAFDIARQAAPQQKMGNVVVAQQLQMQAHDLMDKAEQMSEQAKKYGEAAQKINSELGAYDTGAEAAGAYAAYQSNPGGNPDRELPSLPEPLSLDGPFEAPLPPLPSLPAVPSLGPSPAPAVAR